MTIAIAHADLASRSQALADYGTPAQFVAGFEGPGGLFILYRPQADTYMFTLVDGQRTFVMREVDGDLKASWDTALATRIANALADGAVKPKDRTGRLLVPPRTVQRIELDAWPLLVAFLRSEDDFLGLYHGPGGVYMVCPASTAGGIARARYLIMTMRGETREIVWLYLEPRTTAWSSVGQAHAVAHALATGAIAATQTAKGEWVVDEFEADKVDDD